MTDLCFAPIDLLARQMADGRLTSVALARAFLDRIAATDGHYNSYVEVFDDVEAQAGRADVERAAGLDRGPLHGIPIAIKDLIDVAGHCTTFGMTLRRGHVAGADATLVRCLRAAGAVILGKLALTEGALAWRHPDIAAPRNPWDPDRSAGFSSSGSGVAVAAGLCVAALGSDTAGSIRIPASFNGVTGVKPTWGRVSRHGVCPLMGFLDTVGPMARDARAAAVMLAAIAGPDPADPTAALVPVDDYQGELGLGVGAVAIGVDWRHIEQHASPAIFAALRHAAKMLVDRGATLRPVTMATFDHPAITPLLLAGIADAHRHSWPRHAGQYGPAVRAFLEAADETSAAAIGRALEVAGVLRGQIAAMFARIDLLLVPATIDTARPVGEVERALGIAEEAAPHIAYTLPFNVSGHPSVTFPAGFDADGLPCGVQLVARPFEEGLALRAAHAFQTATDWGQRRPPA